MHTGGGAERGNEGGIRAPRVPPSKDFKKLNHKNAIKHKNRGPPPKYFHNPEYPPQKKLKITVHL
jgi:hypothetical protein